MSTMYNVKNRSASMVVYRIPEENIRREFQPGETKKITHEELEKLSYRRGGRELMANFLQIQSVEGVKELGIHTEPEYNMSEQDVVELLAKGSLDAFLDALDFAPMGIIDLIKQYAISLPLNDIQKRKALMDKTGFDVTKALEMERQEKMDEEPNVAAAAAPERRVKVTEESQGRRTTGSAYKVVNKSTEE